MSDCIVMSGDPTNGKLDKEYAEKIINQFRNETGWEVKEGTAIYDHLTEFSKRYSEQKRDVIEVVTIFRIAAGI